jgi:hypothetical protein
MHMFTNWTLCPLHMPQPICVQWYFINMLVVTKKLETVFGVTWVLLLIGFWLNGDIRWLAACITFFANNVLCSIYTCFFMVIVSFPLCYAIKPWQHLICTRLWFQGHKCDYGISYNCEASKQGLLLQLFHAHFYLVYFINNIMSLKRQLFSCINHFQVFNGITIHTTCKD